MNFKLGLVLAIALLFSFNAAHANTFRQSTGVGKFEASLSYEDYEIANEIISSNVTNPVTWNQTYKAPLKRQIAMLRGSYGVLEHLDVFAGIGFSDEVWNARRKDNGNVFTEQSGEDAMLEFGVKGTALKFMEEKMYLAYLAKYSYVKTGDKYNGPPNPSSAEVVWTQYSADVEVGYNVEEYNLIPYAGISVANLEAKQSLDSNLNRYENEENVAYFVGLNKEIKENIHLNIEGTIGGKEGVEVGVNYNF